MKKSGCKWVEIGLLILNALALIGIKTFFKPCGATDEGTYMACHWAGEAVFGTAIVATVLSVVLVCMRNADVKTGLLTAMIPVSVLSMVLPGGLIHLCMMPDMRCRATMRPCVIGFSVVILVLTVVDLLLNVRGRKA